MSKQMKKYCIIGKLVCNVIGTVLFFAIPMIAVNLGGYISTLF